jgi:hypothetical protein
VTSQHEPPGDHPPPPIADRIREAARHGLRAADKFRTKVVDASYTEIGQYALVMAGVAVLLLVVILAALAVMLFL